MATSQDCTTNNPYIFYRMVVTETATDAEHNTSTVNVVVEAWRTNDYVTNYSGLCYLYFWNESTGSWEDMGDSPPWDVNEKPITCQGYTELYNRDFTVAHNDDGSKILWVRSGFSLYSDGGIKWCASPEYQDFAVTLTTLTPQGDYVKPVLTIPAFQEDNLTPNPSYDSITITVDATNASESCHKWWYIVFDEDGQALSDWVLFSEQVGTSQTTTITGLKPNTKYKIKASAELNNNLEIYGNSEMVDTRTSRYRHRNGNTVTLYEHDETGFDTNGIGVLTDVLSCVVTEERNGSFELEMTYPIDGIHYEDLAVRRILYANPNKHDYPQPFRIYSISRPLNGTITVNAEHISYDLSGYTVKPFSGTTAESTLKAIVESQDKVCPFSFKTDLNVTEDMASKVPVSIRYALGGSTESFLTKYGGEIKFDCFDVSILEARGSDRGIEIVYGKNLTDLTQEENCANVYTHVKPYYYKEESKDGEKIVTYITLEGDSEHSEEGTGLVPVYSENPGWTKILPVDMSGYFESTEEKKYPTQTDLFEMAQLYIIANNLGIPEVSLTVSFLDVTDAPEYKQYKDLETVRLCDIVTVKFPKLGVNAKAECVKTVYDVLTNQYNSISIGVLKNDLSSTISNQNRSISGNITRSQLDDAIYNASNMITDSAVARYSMSTAVRGGENGYARIGRLYIIGSAANVPIKIEVYNRTEYCPIEYFLCFSNEDQSHISDTTVHKFKYVDRSGEMTTGAFIYEVVSGQWDVYVKKDGKYDEISAVWNIPSYLRTRIILDVPEAWRSDIPSGAVSATSF